MVYVQEAHASDVWPISSSRYSHNGQPVDIKAPTRDEERCRLASLFARDYGLEAVSVLVDPVEAHNPFEHSYAPWPFRLYVLAHHCETAMVVFKAQPQDASYDLSQVRAVLLRHHSTREQGGASGAQ